MRGAVAVAILLFGAAAAAQQRPIFDVDDFVDPREHDGVLFVSRLVAGGAWNAIDDYRPLHQDTAFVQVANSLYVSRFQFDYKRSEVRGQRDLTWRSPDTPVTLCGCDPPILFPTAPPPGATPAPPLPGSKDTLQLAWYDEVSAGSGPRPTMLRYRVTWSRQPIDTVVTSAVTGLRVARFSGHEQSLGLDADTYFRLRGRDIFGSLQYVYAKRSGTTDNHAQRALVYTSRFPAVAAGPVMFRATVTVGGVSDRGGTAVNVVHPAFEVFWRPAGSDAAFHFVWTPQSTNSGAEGWRTTQQIALFADGTLLVKRFRR
ncbi:MAG TPA: hypothetical protein VHL59_19525 [Thermoanaerobaculia bacterium]|nr:hypothetical protein [Thermoanaerobaculia bacterium]